MGDRSPLSKNSQIGLLTAAIHKGHQDFWDHPATKATVNGLLFVATGGIEGMASLGRMDANLIAVKTAAKTGTNAFTYTKSAGKHLTEVVKHGENAGQLARPYMKSPLTIQEIISILSTDDYGIFYRIYRHPRTKNLDVS